MARAVLMTIALVLSASASARADANIFTLAGSGTSVATRDGMPAIRAGLGVEPAVAALPGGGFLIGDGTRVWRAGPDGVIRLAAANLRDVVAVAALPGGGFLAGGFTRVWRVDPQGRIQRTGWPGATAIAALPDGGFVFADATSHVHRVGPDGSPSALPDMEADDLSAAPDGSVLLADRNHSRIARLGPDGKLSVVTRVPREAPPTHVAALPDGGFVYSADERVMRAAPDGSVSVLAGAGPFVRTAPGGLQQRLSGQSALRADVHYVSDLAAAPDGGVLIAHGRADPLDEGGFVDYVTPAAPAVLGAAILRDRGRVFTPGGIQNLSVSLTAAATVTLSVAGRSVTRDLPAGVSKLAVPSPPRARPYRVALTAAADTRRAFDRVRIFPPSWLPTETAALVAGVIASDVGHCRRFGPRRVDCATNKGDPDCHSVTVRLVRERLRAAEYDSCTIRSHPHLAEPLRPVRGFGGNDEAALVPAT